MTLAPMLRNGLMASVVMLAAGAASAAPLQLVVDGAGQLTGARNVVVNGTAYDVSFDNGGCAAVFGSCTQAAFAFQDAASAALASAALLSLVLVDGPAGDFDSHPERVLGCAVSEACSVVTPFDFGQAGLFYADAVLAINCGPSCSDRASAQVAVLSTLPLAAQGGGSTWAVWVPSPTNSVPEPQLAALLALGAAALGCSRLRRRSRWPSSDSSDGLSRQVDGSHGPMAEQ